MEIFFKLIFFLIFILSLSFHEYAHAYIAYIRGDNTAYSQGRLSLNPMRHIDPVGTILLPLLGIFTGALVIGWAKPVPVNPRNYKDPENDDYWVSLAGPMSNILVAIVFAISHKFLLKVITSVIGSYPYNMSFSTTILLFLLTLCKMTVSFNITLAIFNLLPIPPLDGSWILRSMLGEKVGEFFDSIQHFGFIILLIMLYTGAFSRFLWPLSRSATGFLLN